MAIIMMYGGKNTLGPGYSRGTGVMLVRERAKVGSAAAQGDWPRRARRANDLGGVCCSVCGATRQPSPHNSIR